MTADELRKKLDAINGTQAKSDTSSDTKQAQTTKKQNTTKQAESNAKATTTVNKTQNASSSSSAFTKASNADKLQSALSKVQNESMPKAWVFGQAARNKKIYATSDNGAYIVDTNKKQSKKDQEREAQTGHETLGTDLKQAASSGAKSWLASQMSTGATLALAYEAIRNKDNYYEPSKGSNLWKYLQVTSARTKEANELAENSKEGRGFVGGAVMDTTQQFVENGIDRALSLIPGVGGALHTVSFASRSFGGTAQAQRDAGKSVGTQVVSGIISSYVETKTEMIWSYGGGIATGIGGKMGDNSGVLGRLTLRLEAAIGEKISPVVGKLVMSFGTEAVEEMAADVLNPLVGLVVEQGTKNTELGKKLAGDFEAEEWHSIGDIAYDGLIGGLSGIGGGIVEAAQIVGETKTADDKKSYIASLRNEAEQAKIASKTSKQLHRASMADALDTLLNKRTGKSAIELASEIAGTYVSTPNAYKMLGEQSDDYIKICNEVAEQFAESSFANAKVEKSILKDACYKYLVNGEFATELEGIEDSKAQIATFTKDVITSYAEERANNAKTTKNKAKAAFYSSVLASYFNDITGENTSTASEEESINEHKTYRYTQEQVDAERANAEAEQNRQRSHGLYVDDVNSPIADDIDFHGTPETETTGARSITQEEYNAMSNEDKAKWLLDSGRTTIRIEGGNKISSSNMQLFDAIEEEAKARGYNAELVYNEQSNQYEAKLTKAEVTESTSEQTAFSSDPEKFLNSLSNEARKRLRTEAPELWNELNDAYYMEIKDGSDFNERLDWLKDVTDRARAFLNNEANTQEQSNNDTTLTKAQQNRINKLFSGEYKALTVGVNSNMFKVIQQRAEAENKEVVVTKAKKGNVKLIEKSGNALVDNQRRQKANTDQQSEAIDYYREYLADKYEESGFVSEQEEMARYDEIDERAAEEAERHQKEMAEQDKWAATLFEQIGLDLDDTIPQTTLNRLSSDNTPNHFKGTMYFSYGNEKRSDVKASNTFDAILNGERTATTREARWYKGSNQWKNAKVGDTITFASNKDGTGDIVDVVIDGKYTVKSRIDKDTLRIADDNGKTYKLNREQWSKKEGWAPDSRWFDSISPGDIWLNYHLAENQTSAGEPITSFRGDNAFLSNMYRTPVAVDGVTYPSAENAFQALKCANDAEREQFKTLDSKEAKEAGKHVKEKANWDVLRVDAMIKVLKAKFENPTLKRKLEATGNRRLVEQNDWYDDFWGEALGKNGYNGQNFLGGLLMDLRDGTQKSRAKLGVALQNAIDGNLASLSDYDVQRALLEVLNRAGIQRENNKNILDDINDFILGEFDTDPYGLAEHDETLDDEDFTPEGKKTTKRGNWLRQNTHFGLERTTGPIIHAYNDTIGNGIKVGKYYEEKSNLPTNRLYSTLDDSYTNGVETTQEELADMQKAMLNLVREFQDRRLSIKRSIDLRPLLEWQDLSYGNVSSTPAKSTKLTVRSDGLKIEGKFKKDTVKASVANKFIGYADKMSSSSTARYAQEAGDKANVGTYTDKDVVFVSVVGNRASEAIRMPNYEKTLTEVKKALDSGATIVTDNSEYILNSDYNVGEKWLYDQLKNDAEGYVYSDAYVNGTKIGTWIKSEESNDFESLADLFGEDSSLEPSQAADVIRQLRESYDNGFYTAEAQELKSALMDGFAPASMYDIRNYSIDDRLKLLQYAFPKQDFVANGNKIEFSNRSIDTENEEAATENAWDKKYLNRKAKGNYVTNDSTEAVSIWAADPNFKKPFATIKTKNGTTKEIYAQGWISGTYDIIQASDKLEALEKIENADKVLARNGDVLGKGHILASEQREKSIKTRIEKIKSILEERKNALIAPEKSKLNTLNEEYQHLMVELVNDLEQEDHISDLAPYFFANRLATRRAKRDAQRAVVQAIQDTDIKSLSGVYNEHLIKTLNDLENELESVKEQPSKTWIDRSAKIKNPNRRTTEADIYSESRYKWVQHKIELPTMVDLLFGAKLMDSKYMDVSMSRKQIDDMVERIRDGTYGEKDGDYKLTDADKQYALKLYDAMFKTEYSAPSLGTESVTAPTVQEYNLNKEGEKNANRQTELRGSNTRGVLEQRTDVDGRAVRDVERRPRVSSYTGSDGVVSNLSRGQKRVAYSEDGRYISVYDEREAGKNKRVGRFLSNKEAVGEIYDTIRTRFANRPNVNGVLFLDGRFYDSASGKLNDGGLLTFRDGTKYVITQPDIKVAAHEETHDYINMGRDNNNKVFIVGYEESVAKLFNKYDFSIALKAVYDFGGYTGNEAIDEIVANINAGLTRYGIDFSQWKDALSRSKFAPYLPRVDVAQREREAVGANAPVANRTTTTANVAESKYGNEGALQSAERNYYGTFGARGGKATITNTKLNRLSNDSNRDLRTSLKKEAIISNEQNKILVDSQLASTGEYGGAGSVSAESVLPNIKPAQKSYFKVGNNGEYSVYIAYSQGTQEIDEETGEARKKHKGFAYTAEIYKGNVVVSRFDVEVNQEKYESPTQKDIEEARKKTADGIANCIGTFERGDLYGVIPMKNGVGSKAKLRDALDNMFGNLSGSRWNAFNRNGTADGLIDISIPPQTFDIGNFRVDMRTNLQDGESVGDVDGKRYAYFYDITTKSGDPVDINRWSMKSDISPAWPIAEQIHIYCLINGERVGANGETTSAPAEINATNSQEAEGSGNVFGEEVTSKTAEQIRAEQSAPFEEREARAISYAEAESAAMSDEEYWELRRRDKDMPSIQDFEQQQKAQPKASSTMSASEADEMATRSFGEKGRVRATRIVEKFQRIKSAITGQAKEIGAKALRIESKMGDMLEALVDVNDGYGTVKTVSDIFDSWKEKSSEMSDYYDEEIAERFHKILEDADNKNWEFGAQDQKEFAQAYEEAGNALIAKITNVNNDSNRLAKLKAEAITNKLNIKSDGLVSKVIQKWIRMQATTDTAMKFFGGFKGSGEFYNLAKDIKDSVAKRMIKYVDAYSYFDNLKTMKGFKEFSENTKTYELKPNVESFRNKQNPFNGHELTLQQIVTIDRLIKTLDKTFEHSDAKLADRIKGFVVRDAKGNSFTVSFEGTALQTANGLQDVSNACWDILNQEGDVFEVAREYDKACTKMFKMMGKEVSAVKKELTGNGLSLIGENYTPVLWANEDGTPSEFNFNDDDRIKPPSFLYNRTAKEGYLVVSDISYIVDKYIEKASDYIGTAKIKDTLSRLNEGTTLIDNGKGLNTSLAENFGKEAGSWFDEYVKDLTTYNNNDSIWAKLRENMQKGALIGSPSVMMKQISSYWSAMGILSPQALAMAYRWKIGVGAVDNSEYNKFIKYRNISDNIDPTLSETIKSINKYGKAANSRVFKLFTNGISSQDFKTVDNLYTATMIDTYLNNQNKGTEYFTSGEFQDDIDSKFAEVMMRSQPMFDVELRAEYARTDNEFIKMTSMFRTQQTQNLNLIATAIGEWKAASEDTKAEKAQVLRRTVAGQASAAVSLSLLSVAADLLLHGLKKYRGDGDDDDEEPGDGKIELSRVLSRIGLNTVETASGTLWLGDQLSKWLIDRISGGETNEFYGVNFGPLTTFTNILSNLENVCKSPTASNIKNTATNIAQLMGIPLNNAYRIVNSAIMYTADATGNNDGYYDDALKMLDGYIKTSTKENKKNSAGKNLLIEAGMSKKEAKEYIAEIDEDGDGLSKDELKEYYIAHPEDADKVSILWDSMGWKQSFEKAKPVLDKKILYNSNPLYAEMDTDESEAISKDELVEYYIEHPEAYDELEKIYEQMGWKGKFSKVAESADKKRTYRSNPLYAEMDVDESESVSKTELLNWYLENKDAYDIAKSMYETLGFKGKFEDAVSSAESTELKETATEAYESNDYNALFDAVTQMKNGKSWLTSKLKEDSGNDYATTTNLLLNYITTSGVSASTVDSVVSSLGSEKLVSQYKALRSAGLTPRKAAQKLDAFDSNDNGSVTQAELAEYYKSHKSEESVIEEFWNACGWKKSWKQYKKTKKIA